MPICSTKNHKNKYVPCTDEKEKLKDIELLLKTIRESKISQKNKKIMLDRVIWLVVESTGNFYSRYRSEGTIKCDGSRIQRDHIYTRKVLVAELLSDAETLDLKNIIERAQCCIVTHAEHVALSRASKHYSGWERYKNAVPPVKVYDMFSETEKA